MRSFINDTLLSVWAVPVYAYFVWLSVVLSIIDFRELRLPNKYVYPAYPIVILGFILPAAISNEWDAFGASMVCGLVGLAVFMLMHVVYPSGLGMGDVKLAGIIGMIAGWVSWSTAVVALMLAFFLSAIVSIALIATRKATMKSALPFGPFMLGGAILAVAFTAFMRALFA
jgi:leader peptidase (prepilin peptidase) / N-methyltransferase